MKIKPIIGKKVSGHRGRFRHKINKNIKNREHDPATKMSLFQKCIPSSIVPHVWTQGFHAYALGVQSNRFSVPTRRIWWPGSWMELEAPLLKASIAPREQEGGLAKSRSDGDICGGWIVSKQASKPWVEDVPIPIFGVALGCRGFHHQTGHSTSILCLFWGICCFYRWGAHVPWSHSRAGGGRAVWAHLRGIIPPKQIAAPGNWCDPTQSCAGAEKVAWRSLHVWAIYFFFSEIGKIWHWTVVLLNVLVALKLVLCAPVWLCLITQ